MDRLMLVELIEAQKAKLSFEALEMWEELDALIYLSDERENTRAQQAEIADRMSYLSAYDQGVVDRLIELRGGLYDSDKAEGRGESGEEHRDRSVINAALLLDRDEIRQGKPAQMDLYRTVDQALARLREEG